MSSFSRKGGDMEEKSNATLNAAKEYAQRGWYVFPIHSIDNGECTCGKIGCSDAGKHPKVFRGLKEATRDLDKIEDWFGGTEKSNIGIVTGEISGITVIDIDVGEGKGGAESWAELIKEKGEPETLMSQTGSGGMHVIFQYNSSLKTASNVLGKGIDSRNDGGYIVAPPSVHRSGGVYEWINPETKIAILPAHLSRRKENRGRPRRDNTYKGKYTLDQVQSMLESVPSHDRDMWRSVGVILGREYHRSDEAWKVYIEWADKDVTKKGRNHDQIMHEAFYEISQQGSTEELSIATIVKYAIENGWAPVFGEVPIEHFVFYAPGNNFIYRPTISNWISTAVDAAVSPVNKDGQLLKASEWLKRNQLVTSMTCDPDLESDYLKGYDCREGEIVIIPGAALFNTYRKPTIELGDAKLAGPFLSHIRNVFNKTGDGDQFLDYMAHRAQKPGEKPRFALLIAGGQGVGKDTAIEFCTPAIGAWNVASIEPSAFESDFNEFAATTLVRISEAANLHEMSKWAFNERTKVLIAGSPDYCKINPKYGQKYSVRMYCGVIITTNHLASGIYIPQDDRRYDVIEAATMEEMGLTDQKVRQQYFIDLWDWFLGGGANHIAAYLHDRDISKFSASNGQRKTDAHHAVVASGLSTDAWLDDILEELGWPVGVRADTIVTKAEEAGENRNTIKQKMSSAIGRIGYICYKNPDMKDGRWRIGGKKVMVYVKSGTSCNYNPSHELNKEVF